MLTLRVATAWDGRALPHASVIQLLSAGTDLLEMRCFAPFRGDPPPNGPPGPTPGLFNHEVAELFIAGPSSQYLELELGPHGHHLGLRLDGVRRPFQTAMPMRSATRRCGAGWWAGSLWFPRAWLPEGPHRVNAYRIAGQGDERSYEAAYPTLTERPDFHVLDRFAPAVLPAVGAEVDEQAAIDAAIHALGAVNPSADGAPPAAADALARWSGALVGALHAAGRAGAR